MILIIAFVAALLFNFFVIIFGKKDVDALKSRMSIGRYLKEINEALSGALGDRAATFLKLLLTLLAILFLFFHLIPAILAIICVALGTTIAKRLCRVSGISAFMNRIATYINRLR